MGKPIPTHRLGNALATVRDMLPDISTENATLLVGKVAQKLERDQPYEAMQAAQELNLDLTGAYRLFAVLLTA